MLPPCGPLRIEHARRVDDGERRPHERARGRRSTTSMFWCRRLRRPPSDAVPVLHRRGVLGEVVVLGDGHVDDLVGVDERREDGPLVEHLALEAHRAEAVLRGEDDLGARVVRRLPDARALEAAVRLVARGVGDDDLLRARVEGEARRPRRRRRGFVFAAWMGMRSQPMLGLTTTTSPRETKRFIPPSASTALRTSAGRVRRLPRWPRGRRRAGAARAARRGGGSRA